MLKQDYSSKYVKVFGQNICQIAKYFNSRTKVDCIALITAHLETKKPPS